MNRPTRSLQEEVERYEARDLDKRTGKATEFKTASVNSAPNPRIRRCNNCNRDVELNDQWECSTPGCVRWDGKPTQVFWSTEKLDCDECGKPAWRLWRLNKPGRIHCDCKESPAQKRDREAREREQRFQKAKKMQSFQDARSALSCWESMGRCCEVTKTPFAYCYACPRFQKGANLQAELRRYEREQASQRKRKDLDL